MKRSRAAKKLNRFLEKNNFTRAKFGHRVDVSSEMVRLWGIGRSVPIVTNAVRIERITRGYISVYDWGRK